MIPLLQRLPERGVETPVALLQAGPLHERLVSAGIVPHVIGRRFPGDLRTVRRIVRLANRLGCDWIHTHGISSNFYGRLAVLLPGCPPVITTVHAFTIDELRGAVGWKAGFMHRIDFSMHRLARLLITPSGALRNALIARGIPPGKVLTIPHGIDPAACEVSGEEVQALRRDLQLEPDQPLVGIVGRLTAVKNHELFFQVAERLAREWPKARFLVIGSGSLEGALKERVRELGIGERVIFTGWVSPVMPWIRLLDVMVMTSHSEGFGLAVIEAMACGVPVVSVRVAEIPTILGDESLVVDSGDRDELAERIGGLLADVGRRREVGERLKRRVEENYRFEAVLSGHLAVYGRRGCGEEAE